MDSRIGLDLIVEDEEYTTKLGSGKTLRDIHKNRKLSWVVELHTFQSFFCAPERFGKASIKRSILKNYSWNQPKYS